jgi:hypothetical protein
MTLSKKIVIAGLLVFLVGYLALILIGRQTLAAQAAPAEADFSSLAEADLYEVQMSSDHYDVIWDVVASGGGDISSAHFQVSGTIGQPTVGEKSSDHYETCTGYWCWLDRIKEVFLPLILRGS